MLSFVPATFEIIGYILLAPVILGLTHTEAAVMGAVLSAVSPAVVIPRMVQLMDNKYGTNQAIPQMIMLAPLVMIFLSSSCLQHF